MDLPIQRRRRPKPLLAQLNEMIVPIPIAGCHLWTGQLLQSGGYGVIGYGGKQLRVHRLMWFLENGPIPRGLYVCHRCDTPSCVNPHHLFLGTPQENMDDMMKKGRNRFPGATNPARGSKSGLSKLSESDVLEIRRLAASGVIQQAIADLFGVTRTNVLAIVNRRSWRHI
jgi:hypothetical protein